MVTFREILEKKLVHASSRFFRTVVCYGTLGVELRNKFIFV